MSDERERSDADRPVESEPGAPEPGALEPGAGEPGAGEPGPGAVGSEAAEPEAAELEAVREALEDLRREIRVRFGGSSGPEPSERVLPLELYSELRRRLATLGMSERSGEVDEFGMDEVVLRRARPLLDFLYDRYWRVEVGGGEQFPEKGPCLVVANHSGLLPYDGLILAHAIERLRPQAGRPRFFLADWLMTLPFAQPYLARLGGVRACRENAERLLRSGRFVVVFPEGAKGATKVFRERYRLKRFGRGGVVRVALETGAPLVPVGIVGAEEANPVLFKWVPPGRSVPFVPVTPTFPLLGPLGLLPLPSKWIVRVGAPIDLARLGPDAAGDELLLSRLTEDLRSEIQALVEAGLHARHSVWA
jgi:1-acyl-sn-glycerol-3-phosphate acyltransferase